MNPPPANACSGQTPIGPRTYYELVSEARYVDKYYQQDFTGASSSSKDHIYLGSTKLATLNDTTTTYYILSDHLGSSTILTDTAGSAQEVTDYSPFGGLVYENGTSSVDNKYKFTGKELDTETALQYYGARYYDDNLGRFNSVDSALLAIENLQKILSNPQKLNSYAYTLNNPLVYIDPDGKTEVEFWAGGFVGAGQAALNIPLAIIHPIKTAEGLGATLQGGYDATKSLVRDLVANPQQTFGEVTAGLSLETQTFLNASDYDRGKAVGAAAFNTALTTGIIGKAGDLSLYKDNPSIFGIKGEQFQASIDVYRGAKGAGITVRDLTKETNYRGQRIFGIDVHDIDLPTGKYKLPHIDADLNLNIFGKEIPLDWHHWPWPKK